MNELYIPYILFRIGNKNVLAFYCCITKHHNVLCHSSAGCKSGQVQHSSLLMVSHGCNQDSSQVALLFEGSEEIYPQC